MAFEPGKSGTNARTEAEAEIETLRQRGGPFVEAVARTRMPMTVTDARLPGNPIVFANDAFFRLSGYSMTEVLGQQPHFLNGPDTDPDDAARFREALRAARISWSTPSSTGRTAPASSRRCSAAPSPMRTAR